MTDEENIHPKVAAAAEVADAKLAKLAPRITKAAPKQTSSAVLTLFKSLFLPMLVPILGGLIVKYAHDSAVEEYLIDGRNVLLKAYPLDEYPEE
jgi:uncharacterized membrane protein